MGDLQKVDRDKRGKRLWCSKSRGVVIIKSNSGCGVWDVEEDEEGDDEEGSEEEADDEQ